MSNIIVAPTNMGYLGEDFQYRLVKCFIEHKEFFENICHVLDQNMFTQDSLRRIVGYLRDRYEQSGVVSSYFELETMIRTKVGDGIARENIIATLNEIKSIPLVGMDLVEEESDKFFKQQILVKCINKAADIVKEGNADRYYDVENLFTNALNVNMKDKMGHHLFENIEAVLTDDYRETITTGCKELDESLYGGLGKGELGVIVAPAGIGKTSVTTGFAAAAALAKTEANNMMGYKVLHFFFEDKDASIERKYYGYMLDIDACDISKPGIREIAVERLKENSEEKELLHNNIIVHQLTTGEHTASDVENLIRSYIAQGFNPDLVIVDYFECLRAERGHSIGDSDWTKEGVSMRKLEAIANKYNIALWVPVQGTKGSIGVEFVGMEQAGGSVRKVQIGHLIITLGRTQQQIEQGRLNVAIQKLRAARIGRSMFKNVKFNNGTGKFDMSDTGDDLPIEDSNGAMEIAKEVMKNRH